MMDDAILIDGFTLRDNVANLPGGAIRADGVGAPVTFSNLIITNNSASTAGGVSLDYGDYYFEDVIIHDNEAGHSGGGMVTWQATVTMTNCTISNNHTLNYSLEIEERGGAGIANGTVQYPSWLILNNVTVSGNEIDAISTHGLGAGIWNANPTSSIIINGGLISGNVNSSPAPQGAAIYSVGALELYNVTITNNTSATNGNAIWISDGNDKQITIANSILHDNGDITPVYIGDASPTLDISYSNIQDGTLAVTPEVGTLNWGEGNIDVDPQFIDAESGDYTLLASSPCINSGDPEFELDPDGTTVDMGAYYYHNDYTGLDWYVDVAGNDTTGTGEFGSSFASIQAALNWSGDGHTIHVGPGTYYEYLVIAHDLSLIGTDGAEATIISGNLESQPPLISFANPGNMMDDAILIDGFTLRDNVANLPGGAIRADGVGADITFSNLIITNNYSSQGGGMSLDYGNYYFEDVIIHDNEAGHSGGGMVTWNATVPMTNCTISNNRTLNYSAEIEERGGAGIANGTVQYP
ncbi:uncharacterized protein METZ01_LOCUS155240, partial [marine metagenome]